MVLVLQESTNSFLSFVCYLTFQIIPLTYWSYVIQLQLLVFIPISGRRGAVTNPDILVGCSVSVLFVILIQFIIPIFVKMEKRTTRRVVTALVRERITVLILQCYSIFRNPITIFNALQIVFNLNFQLSIYAMAMFTVLVSESLGFPYDEDPNTPAQKRLVILKTERRFQNSYVHRNSKVDINNFNDTGFYVIR